MKYVKKVYPMHVYKFSQSLSTMHKLYEFFKTSCHVPSRSNIVRRRLWRDVEVQKLSVPILPLGVGVLPHCKDYNTSTLIFEITLNLKNKE